MSPSIFLLFLLFHSNLSLDLTVFNLTHFLSISDSENVLRFAKIVYEKGLKKREINGRVEEWSKRKKDDVQTEYKRFLSERKYSLTIAEFNLKTEKMKVKMCLPKVMEVLQMNNLGYWEKIRKLKPINARCGKVPTKLIRKFIEEYGLEFNPFEIFRINHPDLEAPWVQWPTISMPERIAFMDIIQKNISESQMKDEIDQWGAKLAPKVKEMFDVWHANYTKSLKKGRLEIVDSVEKISKSIDEIVELRKDFELTFVEEHSKIATILRKLTKRQRHLLREVAWMELRVLDEYPLFKYGLPKQIAYPLREIDLLFSEH